MQKQLFFLCITMLLICSSHAQLAFTITNPIAVERKDELIMLKRIDIEKSLDQKDFAGITLQGEGVTQPVQYIYSGNNAAWDKIAFLCSFKPNETKAFTLIANKSGSAYGNVPVPRAHVRMKPLKKDSTFGASISYAEMPYQNPPTDFSKHRLPPYLTEGPGWENDKVAFRLYFDTRNTVDIYGKRISGMVMDTVGANPANSYHDLSNWGIDILHVVKSLGAGSLAIATKDENGRDTLIRLGGNDIQKETYQQLADGPLYASFEVNYQWKINSKPVTVKQVISIWGGQYFYESKVTVTGAPQGARLVSGIADFYQNTVDSMRVDNAAVLMSFGKQSENKDELGMAVIIPQQSFASFSEAPKVNSDIMETHLTAQNIADGKPLTLRFYSCWSKTDEQFASPFYFKQFIKNEALKFSEPLIIK